MRAEKMRNFTTRNTASAPEAADVGIRYRVDSACGVAVSCRESVRRATSTYVCSRSFK